MYRSRGGRTESSHSWPIWEAICRESMRGRRIAPCHSHLTCLRAMVTRRIHNYRNVSEPNVLESLPPISDEPTVVTTLTLQKAMRYLQPRCRETLYLHYFEGRSASDVARELDTTNRYAEKLIHNCLKRVREIYFSITQVRR